MNYESIYRFLSALAVTQEQLMYCKNDLITIHRASITEYVSKATNRQDRRKRERFGEESMKSYITAIERFYNSANKILVGIENDERGVQMMDQIIEKLTESMNQIQIELQNEPQDRLSQ